MSSVVTTAQSSRISFTCNVSTISLSIDHELRIFTGAVPDGDTTQGPSVGIGRSSMTGTMGSLVSGVVEASVAVDVSSRPPVGLLVSGSLVGCAVATTIGARSGQPRFSRGPAASGQESESFGIPSSSRSLSSTCKVTCALTGVTMVVVAIIHPKTSTAMSAVLKLIVVMCLLVISIS